MEKLQIRDLAESLARDLDREKVLQALSRFNNEQFEKSLFIGALISARNTLKKNIVETVKEVSEVIGNKDSAKYSYLLYRTYPYITNITVAKSYGSHTIDLLKLIHKQLANETALTYNKDNMPEVLPDADILTIARKYEEAIKVLLEEGISPEANTATVKNTVRKALWGAREKRVEKIPVPLDIKKEGNIITIQLEIPEEIIGNGEYVFIEDRAILSREEGSKDFKISVQVYGIEAENN